MRENDAVLIRRRSSVSLLQPLVVRTLMEKHPQPNPKPNSKKEKKKTEEFEFCKVCNLNHNQGQRHKYFPNHTKSLSSFLSRFHSKLSDVRFFLKNPTPLRPEHASRNRFWCVLCDSDTDELGSSFACSNAIDHLASSAHLKNLKAFLWKYGGGMDRIDSFRVSEADLAKWEKKCNSLKIEASSTSEGSRGVLFGLSNDIHNDLNYENVDNLDKKNTIHSVKSSFSNGVMPLQNYTNENYQVSHSEFSQFTNVGPPRHEVTFSQPASTHFDSNLWGSKHLTDCDPGNRDSQHYILSSGKKCTADGYRNNGRMYQVYRDGSMVNGEISTQGLQTLTQISPKALKVAEGNVHSGAPPPWFEATDENLLNVQQKPELGVSSLVSPVNKPGKCRKLNPKRVGAAWAEKRKIELEMEKRGEIVTSNCDANWLPNFGRVWQSGSRKESRKEFEKEKDKANMVESQSEMSFKIQPYVSKRMRREENE